MGYYDDHTSWEFQGPDFEDVIDFETTYSKYIIERIIKKKTSRALLIDFGTSVSWVPKSVTRNLKDTSIEILDTFNIKNLDEPKTIQLGE